MKKTLLVASALCMALTMQAQEFGKTHAGRSTGQKPFPLETYEELANPIKTDLALWENVKQVNVSWGSIDVRYKKEEPALKKITRTHNLAAWKGEKVSSQFVVWGNEDLDKLNFEVSEIKHNGSDYTIGNEQLTKGFVRYVMTDELNKDGRGGCGYRPNPESFDSTLVADPIDHLTKTLKVKKQTSQGCWVGVKVPADAPAGNYSGTVTVKNGDKVLGSLALRLKVNNRILPEPTQWAFHLDLWQNPFAVARYHQVEPWSEAHMKALKPYMELYRDAGGKVITASIMHKPWNGQTHDYFESMVTWVKKLDGSWYFDYAVFDKWVQFMFDLGIDKQINCYSMVPWKLSYQYFDQASNSFKTIESKPGEKAYSEVWTAMLSSFAKHLKEKGWFDKTFISMDERPMEVMLTTLKLIRGVDPDFKISLAGSLHDELINELDDYCVALSMKYTDEMVNKRRAAGKVTTYYTCCSEPYPNTFTFSAPAEGEWLGLYAAKAHLDGYLRWALNSWVVEPLLDSRFTAWAAGDTYQIYPGGRTSIRFERLIEGIQEYEKIRILREENKNNPAVLRKIDKALQLIDERSLEEGQAAVILAKVKRMLKSVGL